MCVKGQYSLISTEWPNIAHTVLSVYQTSRYHTPQIHQFSLDFLMNWPHFDPTLYRLVHRFKIFQKSFFCSSRTKAIAGRTVGIWFLPRRTPIPPGWPCRWQCHRFVTGLTDIPSFHWLCSPDVYRPSRQVIGSSADSTVPPKTAGSAHCRRHRRHRRWREKRESRREVRFSAPFFARCAVADVAAGRAPACSRNCHILWEMCFEEILI